MARIRAPELTQTARWLNCDRPLSLKALRGKIVLLDFWTYGCINCLHVIPDLCDLEQKYGDRLTIIGIHTAKFDQEQNLASIQQAVLRYGIQHPVVVDGDRKLWDQYAVRAYPTFVLIDPLGYIVTTLSGEGQRQFLDQLIGGLISQQAGESFSAGQFLQTVVSPQPQLLTPLAFPGKVVADAATNSLFIADSGHHRIVVTTLGGTLKTIVGNGNRGWQDGTWETAQFQSPQGMAFDPSQQLLYVADAGNHCIRQVDLVQQKVTTLAGTGSQSHWIFPHGGRSREVALNSPWDVVWLQGKLYVAMAGSHQIWVMDLAKQTIQTLIGTGAEFCVDGAPDVAAFAQPYGITTDGFQLFVADSETSSIRAITLGEIPQVRTVWGGGDLFNFGDRDATGQNVRLQHCSGLTHATGKLWITDTYNHKIKQLDPITEECFTIAGDRTAGLQNGMGTDALFSEPSGISFASHHLYIADTNNHVIRCINLDSLEVSTLSFPGLCPPNVCLPTNF